MNMEARVIFDIAIDLILLLAAVMLAVKLNTRCNLGSNTSAFIAATIFFVMMYAAGVVLHVRNYIPFGKAAPWEKSYRLLPFAIIFALLSAFFWFKEGRKAKVPNSEGCVTRKPSHDPG